MKCVFFHYGLFVSVICLLPNCGRIVDWGRKTVDQAEKVGQFDSKPKQHVRSAHVYDQLQTRAIFDALWLSDEVRTAYADAYAQRFGKSEEQRNVFLRRQLAENSHFVSFYVLSLHSVPLGDPASEWGVFLNVNGEQVVPLEIKVVDLDPEYKHFFGRRHTRFKAAYLVKFDAKDLNEKPIITEQTRAFDLAFRSLKKETHMQWRIDQRGRALKTVKRKHEKAARCDHRFDVYEEVEVETV